MNEEEAVAVLVHWNLIIGGPLMEEMQLSLGLHNPASL